MECRLVVSSLGLGPGYGVTLLADGRCGDDLTKIAELIQAGKVKPIVEKVFPLEKTAYVPLPRHIVLYFMRGLASRMCQDDCGVSKTCETF